MSARSVNTVGFLPQDDNFDAADWQDDGNDDALDWQDDGNTDSLDTDDDSDGGNAFSVSGMAGQLAYAEITATQTEIARGPITLDDNAREVTVPSTVPGTLAGTLCTIYLTDGTPIAAEVPIVGGAMVDYTFTAGAYW